MKHKLAAILMVGIILATTIFAGGAVSANDGNLPSAGNTPDKPFYFLDKLGKSISMAFTFSNEAKANKSLQYAEERLAEAQQMASENKTAALEKAIADFENYIASLQEQLAKIKEQAASDNLSEKTANALTRQIEMLQKMKELVPDKAKGPIAHAENTTMNGQINALRNLGKDKPEKAFDICDNITRQQLDRIKKWNSDNVTSGNNTRPSANVTMDLDYTERLAALQEEILKLAEDKGINVTAILKQLEQSTSNRLDVLSGVYSRAPEAARPGIANAIENSVKKYENTLDKLQSHNITAPMSVNETLKKIPEKVLEKMTPTTSNHAPTPNNTNNNHK